MKMNTLSFVALLGGFGAIAACGSSTTAPPRGHSGSGNTGNTGNVGNFAGVGTAGSGNTGNVGIAGTGNTGNIGTGGSGNTGNVGTAGTGNVGTGGITFTTSNLLDDMQDGDNGIFHGTDGMGNDRVGYWYVFNDTNPPTTPPDTTGMQWPPPDLAGNGSMPFIMCGGATLDTTNCKLGPGHTAGAASDFWAESHGTGFTQWGAGIGFTLNNQTSTKMPYNASAYNGVSFWAKSDAALTIRAKVAIPTITEGSDYGIDAALTTGWTQFMMPFASITQPTWAKMVTPFTKNAITDVQFQVNGPVASFDIAIDDVSFF